MELYSKVQAFISAHERELLWLLLGLSICVHAYTYTSFRNTDVLMEVSSAPSERTLSKRSDLYAPYGFQTHVRTVYDGSEAQTYTDSIPLTKEDVYNLRKEMHARDQVLRAHFKKQEQLFEELWNSFPRW